VLPSYERMRIVLQTCIDADDTYPTIREGAVAGLEKLEEYYSKARSNDFNTIATVCHPTLRTSWFRNLGEGEEEKAEELFEKVYTEYQGSSPAMPAPSVVVSVDPTDFLGSLAAVTTPVESTPQKSELERYKSMEGGLGNSKEPLRWWKVCTDLTSLSGLPADDGLLQEHAHDFPVIAKIARDYLAIPGTSVSVERLFSSSRHLCSDLRSSLHAESISEAMCAKMWIRAGLLKY